MRTKKQARPGSDYPLLDEFFHDLKTCPRPTCFRLMNVSESTPLTELPFASVSERSKIQQNNNVTMFMDYHWTFDGAIISLRRSLKRGRPRRFEILRKTGKRGRWSRHWVVFGVPIVVSRMGSRFMLRLDVWSVAEFNDEVPTR